MTEGERGDVDPDGQSPGPQGRASSKVHRRWRARRKGEFLPIRPPKPRESAVSVRWRSKPSGWTSKPYDRRRSSHVVDGPIMPSQYSST